MGKEVETCFLQGAKAFDRKNSSLEQSLNAELGKRTKTTNRSLPSYACLDPKFGIREDTTPSQLSGSGIPSTRELLVPVPPSPTGVMDR